MSLLTTVNAMRANIDKANAVVAQLQPLHEEFQTELKDLAGLDRTKMYFGVNEDGTATILDFDQTPGASFGAPRFNTAEPLPAVETLAVAPPEEATAEEDFPVAAEA